MLLYSLLHLTGYDVSLDAIKNFRQFGSITPGHPEYGLTPGVEVTTGPLGQGFGQGVGMAIAATHLAATFNKPGHEIIQSYIYGIVTDGDLMEGVSSEAASLADICNGAHVYLYDETQFDRWFLIWRSPRSRGPLEAYKWHVQKVECNDVKR